MSTSDQYQRRRDLLDYTEAARKMELAEVAIGVLEAMKGATAQRLIEALKLEQKQLLVLLDSAAAKLGAPYPNTEPAPVLKPVIPKQPEGTPAGFQA